MRVVILRGGSVRISGGTRGPARKGHWTVRILAIINQKGGCGKTTTSINLAAALAELGRRTLLVDMDPQGHCALGLAVPDSHIDQTIAEALLDETGRFNIESAIWQISRNLDLIPSNLKLATIEQKLAGSDDRALRLASVLGRMRDRYDLCVVDCPPNVGLLTFNALLAAQDVIVPVETGYFSLQGAIKQAQTLEVVSRKAGREPVFHVLPTMYDARTRMAREILGELKKHFGARVLPTPIHYNTTLKEAATFGQPISEYDGSSRGNQDFEALARHLISMPAEPRPAMPIDSGRVESSLSLLADEQDPSPVVEGGDCGKVAASTTLHIKGLPRRIAPTVSPDQPPVVEKVQPAADVAGGAATGTPHDRRLNRAEELAERARALAERANQLQSRLASDPLIGRMAGGAKVSIIDQLTSRQTLEEKLRRLYGVRVTDQGALFVQPLGQARQMSVAGEFNGWSPAATPMTLDEKLGVWQACIRLSPGRYQYRLVMDGRWGADPHNEMVERNPFGDLNSVVEVR